MQIRLRRAQSVLSSFLVSVLLLLAFAATPSWAAEKARLRVDDYQIEAELTPHLHQISARAKVKFTALQDLSVAVFELHNALRVTRVLDEINSEGGNAHGWRLDVLDHDDIKRVVDEAARHFGRLDILINNAGFGAYGKFEEISLPRQLEMVQVNIAAVVHLTHLYLPAMIARRSGDVLILASTAGFQGVPYITTYAATKSFDLFFGEALAEEMRPYGVRVCVLCPGATETEFQEVAAQPDYAFRSAETPDKVARVGLAALAKGKSMVISGVKNILSVQSQRMAPRSLVTGVAAKMFRPRAKGV